MRDLNRLKLCTVSIAISRNGTLSLNYINDTRMFCGSKVDLSRGSTRSPCHSCAPVSGRRRSHVRLSAQSRFLPTWVMLIPQWQCLGLPMWFAVAVCIHFLGSCRTAQCFTQESHWTYQAS
jgi:hypothetical protein